MIQFIMKKTNFSLIQKYFLTCCTGAFFLGPPGLGGESLGFSPVGNQSFLTGAGSGVVYVAIVTSPINRKNDFL